jgi:hypothetical protein
MSSRFAAVSEAVEVYISAIHIGDADLLRHVWHHTAKLYKLGKAGDLVVWDLKQYTEELEKAKPAQGSVILGVQPDILVKDNIESIEFSDQDTAFAVFQFAISPSVYTSLCSLLKIDGKWKIMSNVCTSGGDMQLDTIAYEDEVPLHPQTAQNSKRCVL